MLNFKSILRLTLIATMLPVAQFAAAQANLSVTITDTPDPVAAGQNVSYAVKVINSGPSGATNVTLVNQLPTNATFVSANASQGTTINASDTVTGIFGPILSGGSATMTVVVTATTVGTLTDQAGVTSDQTDPDLTNNTASQNTTVVSATSADLGITMTDSPDPAQTGGTISYSMQVVNHGPAAATGVTVTDHVPSSVSIVSATTSNGTVTSSSGTMTATVGALSNGGTANITLVVRANGTGTVTNSASVSGSSSDPTSSNNTAQVSTNVSSGGGGSETGGDVTGEWLAAVCRQDRGPGTRAVLGAKFDYQNNGTGDAPENRLRIWLSEDDVIDTSDTLLVNKPLGALAAGADRVLSGTIVLNYGVNPAGMFLIAVVDANDVIVEDNEDDNIIVSDPIELIEPPKPHPIDLP